MSPLKDYSQFKKFAHTRAGWNDLPRPYGLYVIPLNESAGILCYLSTGLTMDEEGWVHVSYCIRSNSHLYFNMNVAQRGRSSAWKPRWPTPHETKIVRDAFFRKECHPVSICLDLASGDDKRDLRMHLWSKPGMELPPKILLDSMRL